MTPPEVARRHPRLYLVAYAVGGALVVGLLVWAFAALADEIPENGWLDRADQSLIHSMQVHGTEWGETVFSIVSLLGAPVLILAAVVAAGYFARERDWLRAGAIALTTASGALLNTVLKHVFHRGRPEYASEFITHQSWSFPSGHAMDSMIVYGMLLLILLERVHSPARRRLLIAATIILIFFIGLSRTYLGVHYISDVVGGWLAGGAWLIVCYSAYRFERQRRATPIGQ